MVVLSKLAQKHEMGNSLIERLFNYYKTMPKRCVEDHSASLLTNYRCHSSILTLTSSLFYEYTLLSRSESQTHPLAPYPLVFTCSSIEKMRAMCMCVSLTGYLPPVRSCRQGYVYVCLPDRRSATCAVL